MKYDSEREEWLRSLKVGDKIVLDDRKLNNPGDIFSPVRRWGWNIYTITKITPKRTRFDLECGHRTRSIDRGGLASEGSGYSKYSWWATPLTAEIYIDIEHDEAYLAYAKAVHDKIAAAAALDATLEPAHDWPTERLLSAVTQLSSNGPKSGET